MTQPYKVCPQCQAPAHLQSASCATCGRQYRTTAPDKTQVFGAASPTQPHPLVIVAAPDHYWSPFNRYVSQRPWLVALIVALFSVSFVSFAISSSVFQARAQEESLRTQREIDRRITRQFGPDMPAQEQPVGVPVPERGSAQQFPAPSFRHSPEAPGVPGYPGQTRTAPHIKSPVTQSNPFSGSHPLEP